MEISVIDEKGAVVQSTTCAEGEIQSLMGWLVKSDDACGQKAIVRTGSDISLSTEDVMLFGFCDMLVTRGGNRMAVFPKRVLEQTIYGLQLSL